MVRYARSHCDDGSQGCSCHRAGAFTDALRGRMHCERGYSFWRLRALRSLLSAFSPSSVRLKNTRPNHFQWTENVPSAGAWRKRAGKSLSGMRCFNSRDTVS